MEKLKYIFYCLLAFSFTGCQNWFDVSPKSEVKAEDLFKNESGFRDALTGVYSLMTTPGSYGRQLTYGYADVLAQYYDKISSQQSHEYLSTTKYEYDDPYDKGVLKGIWSSHYKAIANLNAMLMYIDGNKSVFSSETVYKIYKGEALGLRGMLHFDLLRFFAPSPAMGKERKAIPYVDSYTNIPKEQLTVEEVIARVVTDLNAARELIREVDSYGPGYEDLIAGQEEHPLLRNRAKHLNYYAATGLLARVYLYAGDKEKALAAAKEIIGEPEEEPVKPFVMAGGIAANDLFFESEQLFYLEVKTLQDYIDSYFGESVISNGMQNGKALGITTELMSNLFAKQNPADNDYRLAWYANSDEPGVALPKKYSSARILPMLHLSELYYIAAECSATKGWDYLNKLRAHRGLAPLVPSADIQTEIYKEYCKEFLGEGQLFYYYKRLNEDRIGVYKTVPINREEVYILPLPDDELDFGLIE